MRWLIVLRCCSILVACLATILAPAQALAWWEATLQQVEVELLVDQDGQARVSYDLRYHVDRGRFEGLELSPPRHPIEWDRLASYIEDARGRRYPVSVYRRGRDGAQMVRLARPPGLRPGWATVHVEYTADLLDCCVRLDDEGRAHLRWHAFSWDVGMDRIVVTARLAPHVEGLTPDEATEEEFTIDRSLPEALIIERIRPVRWYEMEVGLLIPEGFLRRRPAQLETAEARPTPEVEANESTLQPLPSQEEERPGRGLGELLHGGAALLCLLLLGFKSWITAKGFSGRRAGVGPLLLPRVPPLLRWALLGAFLLVGVWLQSIGFLAAGTLAVAFSVILSLRGPARGWEREEADRGSGWEASEDLKTLEEVSARRERGRRRWAKLFDGTSLQGLPLAAILFCATAALFYYGRARLTGLAVEGIAIDLALVLVAFSLTGRRRDTLPALPESASMLRRASRRLSKLASTQGATQRVLLRGPGGSAAPHSAARLELVREAEGERPRPLVTVETEPELRLGGWSLGLIARVDRGGPGEPLEVRARRPWALARGLRRALTTAEERSYSER